MLTHFRNFRSAGLTFPRRLTLLQGPNAQGKTNVLEAIFLLATSKSPFARVDQDIIPWDEEESPLPYARLMAEVGSEAEKHRIELVVAPVQRSDGAQVFRKRIRIDGAEKRAMDLLGTLKVVLFIPEDIDLITGSPAGRRRYLDIALCQVDRAYCSHLQRYNQILARRNSLLRQLKERGGQMEQLVFWDEQLAGHAAPILVRRRQAVELLAGLAQDIYARLTGGEDVLNVAYLPAMGSDSTLGDEGEKDIEAEFVAGLRRRREKEISAGMTLTGPHRDDLLFLIDDHDLRYFGSRGQQRSVSLSLKLAEVQFIEQTSGEPPILLLDDVMSELDESRRRFLADILTDAHQAVITTADLRDYPPDFLEQASIWHVRCGELMPHDVWVRQLHSPHEEG